MSVRYRIMVCTWCCFPSKNMHRCQENFLSHLWYTQMFSHFAASSSCGRKKGMERGKSLWFKPWLLPTKDLEMILPGIEPRLLPAEVQETMLPGIEPRLLSDSGEPEALLIGTVSADAEVLSLPSDGICDTSRIGLWPSLGFLGSMALNIASSGLFFNAFITP